MRMISVLVITPFHSRRRSGFEFPDVGKCQLFERDDVFGGWLIGHMSYPVEVRGEKSVQLSLWVGRDTRRLGR